MMMGGSKRRNPLPAFQKCTACEWEIMWFERLLKYLRMSWIGQKITVTINYYSNFSN